MVSHVDRILIFGNHGEPWLIGSLSNCCYLPNVGNLVNCLSNASSANFIVSGLGQVSRFPAMLWQWEGKTLVDAPEV